MNTPYKLEIVVNLTTCEYFKCNSEEDKTNKLSKIYDYSTGTKIMTNLLKLVDKSITNDSCGECYWNKTDIIENVDIQTFRQKYIEFDEVPKYVIQ